MSASVYELQEYANSGRGLLARPILPNNNVALRASISAINYKVVNMNTAAEVSGTLTVADVMLTAAGEWDVDEDGYTFSWAAPGTLWPTAGHKYRVIVTFTPAEAGQPAFIEVWEVEAMSPSGL